MKRLHIGIAAPLLGAGFITCALVPVAAADLQGWNGAGWYVTGAAPL